MKIDWNKVEEGYSLMQVIEKENKQLKSQLQQKENIIKEAREYIKEHKNLNWYVESCYIDDLLQILNKGSDKE